MVELVLSYSKRPELLEDLERAARRLEKAGAEPQPASTSVRSSGRVSQPRAVSDRLTADQVQDIVTSFAAGVPKVKLAERHRISRSSVQRLLRKYTERLPPG